MWWKLQQPRKESRLCCRNRNQLFVIFFTLVWQGLRTAKQSKLENCYGLLVEVLLRIVFLALTGIRNSMVQVFHLWGNACVAHTSSAGLCPMDDQSEIKCSSFCSYKCWINLNVEIQQTSCVRILTALCLQQIWGVNAGSRMPSHLNFKLLLLFVK